jgi:hypothetical protein
VESSISVAEKFPVRFAAGLGSNRIEDNIARRYVKRISNYGHFVDRSRPAVSGANKADDSK